MVAYIIVLMMHGLTNIKFINAKKAKGIHLYKNIKRELYGANAAISYNKTCRDSIIYHYSALYQKLYIQSKSAPEDGRVSHLKHVELVLKDQ